MLEPIHKQAILKLINQFTTASHRESVTSSSSASSNTSDPPLHRFKEPLHNIDLPALSRLGIIIAKFEKAFRPNPLIVNGSQLAANQKSPYNSSANLLYLQQISGLVHYIEVTDLFGCKNENNNGMETLQVLQTSEHIQALILLIRDWLLQFYQDKQIVYSLFPTLNNSDNITFSLMDIKENNITVWAILIFNIFYKLRDSFPEFAAVLDFCWYLLFNTSSMESFFSMVRLDHNYVNSLLQMSLLYTRVEDEQERQLNSDLYAQIEKLRGKIVETKKRIQTLAMNPPAPAAAPFNPVSQVKVKREHPGDSFVRIASRPTVVSSVPTIKTGHSKTSKAFIFNNAVAVPGSDKPYRCTVCTKHFPTAYKLRRHFFSHSGERPYNCNWPNCVKRFNDNYHLRRHMNTHTGDKPFPCKYPGCSKRYSRSEDLRNHQKTHYSGGGGDASGGSITAITTNNNSDPSAPPPGSTLHLTNSDGTTLNVLVQSSSNSLVSPVTYSLATSSLTSIPMSKAAIRLATDPNVHDSATQLVLQSHLNQLQLQLQQQSANQQQQQQQNYNSLSPSLADESALQPTIILQESPASSGGQNHVTASLHISDYNF